jgi:hypothetical protein
VYQIHQATQQGGLAGAIRPEQSKDFAPVDFHTDIADATRGPKGFRERTGLNG